MKSPISAALDACVLYPAAVRDTLLTAAFAGIFVPSWSSHTVTETTRNLIADGRMTHESAERSMTALRKGFPSSAIDPSDEFGPLVGVPDDDIHVVAAAVGAHAHYLVTSNLKHFPEAALAPFNVQPISPDEFLLRLHRHAPANMAQVVIRQQAKLRQPPVSMAEVLNNVADTAPSFVAAIRPALMT